AGRKSSYASLHPPWSPMRTTPGRGKCFASAWRFAAKFLSHCVAAIGPHGESRWRNRAKPCRPEGVHLMRAIFVRVEMRCGATAGEAVARGKPLVNAPQTLPMPTQPPRHAVHLTL